eukprot:2753613-Lingulodinium_polyedra.AAC.1
MVVPWCIQWVVQRVLLEIEVEPIVYSTLKPVQAVRVGARCASSSQDNPLPIPCYSPLGNPL